MAADDAEKTHIRVTVNSGGRLVEIDTNEPGMTTEKLTEIAEGAWGRVAPEPGEDRGGAGLGFTSSLGMEDPFRARWGRYRRIDEGRPLDAS